MALLSLQNIKLTFGGHPLLAGINLNLEPGDRYCLIGRNGEGKTTLMRIIEGLIQADSGDVSRKQGIIVSGVPQEIPDKLEGSVASVVAGGLGKSAELIARYLELSARLADSTDDQETESHLRALDRLHEELEAANAWSAEEEVSKVMSRLDLDGDLLFSTLSGGTKRRVLLARALVSNPDLLLLDEPTNHLDLDTIIWLEEFLMARAGALLFVTHDRAFARRLASRVGEIDRGVLYSFDCGYDSFIERRDELLEAERKRVVEFGKKLAQEEAWIRRGVKARRTRDEGRVKALMQMREVWRQKRERSGTARMQIVDAQRSGDLVIEAEGLSFKRGERTIIKDLTTGIMRGDRVGIMGPNGSGKTTLLRLILGDLPADSGFVRRGASLQTIYFDQLREGLDPQATVFDSIAGGDDAVVINGSSRHVNAYLQDFLFSPDRTRSRVHSLSGGERNRLLLAKLFTQPSNLIVLDEPTNDLDAETMDLLEDLLLEYKGTVLVVSHDRDFLDHVVSSTLVIDADGAVQEFAGGYSDWLLQRRESLASPNQNRNALKKAEPAVIVAPQVEKRKLSFKENQELSALPEKIAALEAERARLHARLADPAIYVAGPAESLKIAADLAKIDADLAQSYERWESLEARL